MPASNTKKVLDYNPDVWRQSRDRLPEWFKEWLGQDLYLDLDAPGVEGRLNTKPGPKIDLARWPGKRVRNEWSRNSAMYVGPPGASWRPPGIEE